MNKAVSESTPYRRLFREDTSMKRLFLSLEDGAVFEGLSVNDALETAGLLSFYTGVVGYQEVITDPANLGKITLFTYPLIGNYGVNHEDAESASPKVSGIVTKEYPPYYSNFRATGSLLDYLHASQTVFGTGFDTRAVLLHVREHGEMMAATSEAPLTGDAVAQRATAAAAPDYTPENKPIACAQARARVKATVVDLGASKSFYKHIAALGVDACCPDEKADLVIVSDGPYYCVESQTALDRVKSAANGRPVIGFGQGSAVAARAAGGAVKRMSFGDHGVNIPVRYAGGGRNEITVQNHNYEVIPGGSVEALFTNVHDDRCEGFACASARTAGANFLPGPAWFEVLLKAVGVE